MPVLTVNTNVPADRIPADFLETSSKIVADTLGKPISYVMVHIAAGQQMSFAGDRATPCANCTLSSIGCISASQNKKTSKAISDLLDSKLAIPSDRMYINFVDLQPCNVGFNGSTF
ncbi:macrophage migration inhibitory factor-like [Varroa jacobsoni]|uniref:L-dopachrome isomerase n=1 Tax=Varroa destructor TaxID=109461 RepID=A0A7M7KFX6_VARDE|nr:macrophage migration inhibitory factor-like [Varroa destructor]XP_022691854.1 macrophage migration inhibitory factor-like [Varroa jacobsoni]